MNARSFEHLRVGDRVLVITSSELAHMLVKSELDRPIMQRLMTSTEYGNFLDRIEANDVPRGRRLGSVKAVADSVESPFASFSYEVEVEGSDSIAFRTDDVATEAIEPFATAYKTRFGSDPRPHISSMFPIDHDLVLTCTRVWTDFIGFDSETISTLEGMDDPEVLGFIDEERFLCLCDQLPIAEDDPEMLEAQANGDRDTIMRRIRDVWRTLPQFQPLSLVLADTETNRKLLKGLHSTVCEAMRSIGANMLREFHRSY